jgi:PAS domain S-box-containing protein
VFNLLVIDDSADDAALIRRELDGAGFEFTAKEVDTASAMRKALDGWRCDLVLCDFGLLGFSFGGARGVLLEHGHLDTPVIVVTGTIGEEMVADLMRAGAANVVLKDHIKTRLAGAVTSELAAAALRRQAAFTAELLRRKERQRANVVDHFPGLIYQRVMHNDGSIRYPFVAGRGLDTLNLPPAEVAEGRVDLVKYVHPDDRDLFFEAINRSAAELSPIAQEFRQRTKSGEYCWLATRAEPRRDVDGSVVWDAFAIDVTDLHESEQAAGAIIETSLDAFVQIDESGKIVEWNRQAEATFGWSREAAVGRAFGELLLPKPEGSHQAELHELACYGALEAGRRMELEALRCDGTVIRVELSITANRRHQQLLVNAFIRDLSDKIAAEERLRHSQKMEALGTLAGGMAHDINNYLVPVLSLTELALETVPAGSRTQECMELIKAAGTRIRDLVRRILIFSRREDMVKAPIDLASVINDSIRLLRATLPTTIALHSQVMSRKAVIQGDAGQVQQVLLNLCVNAADAIGDRSGGVIKVALDRVQLADALYAVDGTIPVGRYYRLLTADNGCGMDETTVARIFEPFFTTKAPGHGTGLGLAMVHSIIRSHSGHLRVTSSCGFGSTFEIYLPQPETGVVAS